MFSTGLSRDCFTVALFVLSLFGFCDLANAVETPCLAVSSANLDFPQRGGYRLAQVRWDPVLQKQWATLLDCEHPERPALIVTSNKAVISLAHSSTRSVEGPLLVHAGDRVRLWKGDGDSRIEIIAISEDNGRAGSVIHLHRQSFQSSESNGQIRGIVRGISDVEIAR